jgi:hypothetical protein
LTHVIRRAEVEMAAANDLVYCGNHISKEDEDILPLTAQLFLPADWAAIQAAAPTAPDPLFGATPLERFRELRHRIELEA